MDEITERWPKKKEINDKYVNSQVASSLNSSAIESCPTLHGEGR